MVAQEIGLKCDTFKLAKITKTHQCEYDAIII